MNKPRRHFQDLEKVAILKRHLLDKVPVSNLCNEYDLYPVLFSGEGGMMTLKTISVGRAVVRHVLKTNVGTIASCYVTVGVIDLTAQVRLIRTGVVIHPPSDQTAGLDLLRRREKDVSEVRQGYDCDIKIAGYDCCKHRPRYPPPGPLGTVWVLGTMKKPFSQQAAIRPEWDL
jgi:hypothetical protein